MALMLVAVVLSGVVTSKLLLLVGLASMQTRYGLAVVTAYGVFVALVGVWLMYVRRVMAAPGTPSKRGSSASSVVDFDLGSGSGSGIDVPRFSPGGGSYGGGGASGSFSDADASSVVSQSNVTASGGGGGRSGSGSSWGFDLDLDDGVWIIVAFIVFVSVVAVTAGWVIYDAPHMFGDAAFQFFLASGLLRGTRSLKAGGWTDVAVGGWKAVVIRRTVIPFLIVAVAAVVFGHIAQKLCPEARSVIEAFRLCVSRG